MGCKPKASPNTFILASPKHGSKPLQRRCHTSAQLVGKYRHGFFKTWRPVRNSCGTARNLSSAFTMPTVAGKTVSKTSICSSYITNFLVGGRIIKKSETAVGCGTVQVRLSQCSFCTKNILQHLAHSETPTAWPKTLQRQISLEKKNMILTVLLLGTHKGLSRPLSFSFLGHNGDFRAIHATTTSFADLSQWKRKPYSHMVTWERLSLALACIGNVFAHHFLDMCS